MIRSLETLFNGPDLSDSQREVIEGETSVARCLSYLSEAEFPATCNILTKVVSTIVYCIFVSICK